MKPILFNTEMVRAILEGRKTVTRRVVKTKHKDACGFYVTTRKSDGAFMGVYEYDENESMFDNPLEPPYKAGDVLYVRETWGNYGDGTPLLYKADYPDGATTYKHDDGIHICDLPKWKPSIHMSKEAARIFLKVSSVRVERLQDIDTADDQEFFKEGTADKHSFIELWNSTVKNESQGWYGNPYVWVIEFERVEEPEAAVQKEVILNVRE